VVVWHTMNIYISSSACSVFDLRQQVILQKDQGQGHQPKPNPEKTSLVNEICNNNCCGMAAFMVLSSWHSSYESSPSLSDEYRMALGGHHPLDHAKQLGPLVHLNRQLWCLHPPLPFNYYSASHLILILSAHMGRRLS